MIRYTQFAAFTLFLATLFLAALLLAALLLTGCDGPHEQAGERADVQAGLSDTVGSLKSGPMERAGEKLDEQEAHGPSR